VLASPLGWRTVFLLLALLAAITAAWIRAAVPGISCEPAASGCRYPACCPGRVCTVLASTLLLLTGHEALYT